MKKTAHDRGEEASSSSAFLRHHPSQHQDSKFSFVQEIPLLDEVGELLEKEKTLYRLQTIEANAAAEAWKSKYENLIVEMTRKSALSGNYETCEKSFGPNTLCRHTHKQEEVSGSSVNTFLEKSPYISGRKSR